MCFFCTFGEQAAVTRLFPLHLGVFRKQKDFLLHNLSSTFRIRETPGPSVPVYWQRPRRLPHGAADTLRGSVTRPGSCVHLAATAPSCPSTWNAPPCVPDFHDQSVGCLSIASPTGGHGYCSREAVPSQCASWGAHGGAKLSRRWCHSFLLLGEKGI